MTKSGRAIKYFFSFLMYMFFFLPLSCFIALVRLPSRVFSKCASVFSLDGDGKFFVDFSYQVEDVPFYS